MRNKLVFLFSCCFMFSTSVDALASTGVMFDKEKQWEHRIINGPDGGYVYEIVRVHSDKGPLLVIQGGRGSEKSISVLNFDSDFTCDKNTYLSFVNNGIEKIFYGDCSDKYLSNQYFSFEIDSFSDIGFIFGSQLAKFKCSNKYIVFNVSDNPFVGVQYRPFDEILDMLSKGEIPFFGTVDTLQEKSVKYSDCISEFNLRSKEIPSPLTRVLRDNDKQFVGVWFGNKGVLGMYCSKDEHIGTFFKASYK